MFAYMIPALIPTKQAVLAPTSPAKIRYAFQDSVSFSGTNVLTPTPLQDFYHKQIIPRLEQLEALLTFSQELSKLTDLLKAYNEKHSSKALQESIQALPEDFQTKNKTLLDQFMLMEGLLKVDVDFPKDAPTDIKNLQTTLTKLLKELPVKPPLTNVDSAKDGSLQKEQLGQLLNKVTHWQQAIQNLKDPSPSQLLDALKNFDNIETWVSLASQYELPALENKALKVNYEILLHDLKNQGAPIAIILSELQEQKQTNIIKTDLPEIQKRLAVMEQLISQAILGDFQPLTQKNPLITLSDVLSKFPDKSLQRLKADTPSPDKFLSPSLEIKTTLNDQNMAALLRNLIQNALSHGDPSKEITYLTEQVTVDKKPYFRFRIQNLNLGNGIQESDLATIFKQGSQGQNNQCMFSTGQGLYFIQEIINSCQGKLQLTNSSKNGVLVANYPGNVTHLPNQQQNQSIQDKNTDFTIFSVLIPIRQTEGS